MNDDERRFAIAYRGIAITIFLFLLPTAEGLRADEVDVDRFVAGASIDGIREAVVEGRLQCRDIVAAYQRRIAVYDDVSGLHAITVVNGDALRAAVVLDQKWRGAENAPPLLCAPLLIKDNVDTVGLETAGGSIALQGKRVPRDAPLVVALRAAGAIVVAKTNMAEWAFSPRQTVSSSHGITANAYSLDHVPAGSSGGTASGVAAAFGVAGIGTDTGNSVRGPSSHLALVGLRPSLGVVSRAGIVPLSFDRDTAGPMALSARDAALIMNAIAFADQRDEYTIEDEVARTEDYTALLASDALQGRRIGVLRALAASDETDAEILALFERALDDLRSAGAEIVDPFEVPGLAEHLERDDYFCRRFGYDLAQYLRERGIEDANLALPALVADSRHSVDPRVRQALEALTAQPTDVHPAEWNDPCPDFFAHPGRLKYRSDVVDSMTKARIDGLVYPTWTHPPARIERGNEEYAGDNSQLVAPATGLPAITVPMGWLEKGLPAGLQILGMPYSEADLLAMAYAYEQETGHRRAPEAFPPLMAPDAGEKPD